MDTLGAPFDVELQPSFLEPRLDRSDESVDVGVARLFGGVELVLDHIVGVVLEIFEREVLELALERIESKLMGQWRIEIAGFFRHLVLCLLVRRVADLSHDVHTVGDHDEDHAHILGKAQEQIAEVLAFDDGVFLIELLDADKSVDDTRHVVTESLAYLFHCLKVIAETAIEHRGDDTVAAQSYLVDVMRAVCKEVRIGFSPKTSRWTPPCSIVCSMKAVRCSSSPGIKLSASLPLRSSWSIFVSFNSSGVNANFSSSIA